MSFNKNLIYIYIQIYMSFNKNLPEPAVALASTLQASYMLSHADCPCLFSVNMSSYIYIYGFS